MKYLQLILVVGIAASFTSCKTIGGKKTASASNPYQSNPYYGPASTGNSSYSSTASSSKYPSYTESTYTPPASSATTAPVPTYSSNTYTPAASSGGSGTHTVVKGENLFRISLKHNTSIAAIKSANGLSGDTIHPGQVLQIP